MGRAEAGSGGDLNHHLLLHPTMVISGCLMSQETAKKILVPTVPASDPDQHSHIQDREEPVETLPSANRGLGRRGREISQGNCKVKHFLRCV